MNPVDIAEKANKIITSVEYQKMIELTGLIYPLFAWIFIIGGIALLCIIGFLLWSFKTKTREKEEFKETIREAVAGPISALKEPMDKISDVLNALNTVVLTRLDEPKAVLDYEQTKCIYEMIGEIHRYKKLNKTRVLAYQYLSGTLSLENLRERLRSNFTTIINNEVISLNNFDTDFDVGDVKFGTIFHRAIPFDKFMNEYIDCIREYDYVITNNGIDVDKTVDDVVRNCDDLMRRYLTDIWINNITGRKSNESDVMHTN